MSVVSKILVVDDNDEFCQNMTDILELRGYQVTTASDGLKAIELVKQDDFILVLLDIKLPVMGGVATFKKIKEIVPNTPVIMITAHAVEDLIKEALREGAFGILKKPLELDSLFALIEKAVAEGALILVVDDDENLCANLKDNLSDKGYQVNVAYDGHTAIEMARENIFDVMLIDLKLPSLNGLETYLAIRDIRPNVVAIIISGYLQTMSDLAHQAQREGAYACVEKPIDMDKLVALLEGIQEQKARGTLEKPGWSLRSAGGGMAMENRFDILVVDDDVNLSSNLQDILEAEGYRTAVALNAETALALCREKVFDLAIVDIRLPDISGIELTKDLNELSPEMTFIILTGYPSLDSAVKVAGRRDIIAYVTKPVNIDNMLSLVRHVRERASKRKQ